jgi:beta-lactamase class A
MRPVSACLVAALWLLLFVARQSAADEIEDEPTLETPYPQLEDPNQEQLQGPDEIAPLEDLAPLWDHIDPLLQKRVEEALHELGLEAPIRTGRLGVVLVDISEVDKPRVASVNGDVMMYAASLPKIAVLLAVYEKAAEGELEIDDETQEQLEQMIRESSNSAATELMNRGRRGCGGAIPSTTSPTGRRPCRSPASTTSWRGRTSSRRSTAGRSRRC